MENPSDLEQFIGRFHVVLLHLPIGLLLALGFLELVSLHPKWRHANAGNRFLLVLTVPVTILTALCGWLLAEAGGYDERILWLHRWTGVAIPVVAFVLLLLHRRGWVSVYRVGLGIAIGLTAVAGHFGGTLTHGSGYLTRYAPGWLGGGKDVEAPRDVPDPGFSAVEPVLSEYCVSCHGPEKSKAGLRLDSYGDLLAGSHSGPVIVPGDEDDSLLLKRLLLPFEDEDHMPPEGKAQPGPEEIDLIRGWIRSGAAE